MRVLERRRAWMDDLLVEGRVWNGGVLGGMVLKR
jgi:hypothetical protein